MQNHFDGFIKYMKNKVSNSELMNLNTMVYKLAVCLERSYPYLPTLK